MKYFSGTTWMDSWKSHINVRRKYLKITKSDSNFGPTFVDHKVLPGTNFNGHCLIDNNISIRKKVIYIYIYIIYIYIYIILSSCSFGSIKLTKNADLEKCKYNDYCIGFDSPSEFSFTDGSMGKNVTFWS